MASENDKTLTESSHLFLRREEICLFNVLRGKRQFSENDIYMTLELVHDIGIGYLEESLPHIPHIYVGL